jgi:hypothetical protein
VNASSTFLSPPFSFANASVTTTEDDLLVVLGGSGAATLVLNFRLTGRVNEDFYPESGTSMSFNVSGNGVGLSTACPFDGQFSILCQQTPFLAYFPASISIPVTFGVPFDLVQQLTVTGTGGDGGGAGGGIQAALASISIIDPNGAPLPNATLATAIPEPNSLSLVLPFAILVAALNRAKRQLKPCFC